MSVDHDSYVSFITQQYVSAKQTADEVRHPTRPQNELIVTVVAGKCEILVRLENVVCFIFVKQTTFSDIKMPKLLHLFEISFKPFSTNTSGQ